MGTSDPCDWTDEMLHRVGQALINTYGTDLEDIAEEFYDNGDISTSLYVTRISMGIDKGQRAKDLCRKILANANVSSTSIIVEE